MRAVGALPALALSFIGCSDICSDYSRVQEACTGTGLSDTQLEDCATRIDDNCSDADRETLERYVECVDDGAECEDGSTANDANLLSCAVALAAVDASCKPAGL